MNLSSKDPWTSLLAAQDHNPKIIVIIFALLPLLIWSCVGEGHDTKADQGQDHIASLDNPISSITRWKFTEPDTDAFKEMCAPEPCEELVFDACHFASNSKTIAIVRVTAEPTLFRQCPLKLRGPYMEISIEVMTFIAGNPIEVDLTADALARAHDGLDKNSFYLMSFTQTQLSTIAVNSIEIIPEGSEDFDLMTSSDRVELATNQADLSAQLTPVLAAPDIECPDEESWLSEERFSNFIHATTSECAEGK